MRKLLSLLLCGAAGRPRGSRPAETATLKVWGSQEDQAMLQEMAEAFKASNPDKTYDITFGVVGEPDAKTRYLEDPAAAADVFAFPNDQLYDLLAADALYEVTRNKDAIVAANSAGAIEAASAHGQLYAYPMTADNGYFLYYDKSVISEEGAVFGRHSGRLRRRRQENVHGCFQRLVHRLLLPGGRLHLDH